MKRKVRLSEWARRHGVPLRTAQRRFHEGSLPVPTMVTETGRLMVIVEGNGDKPLTPAEREELFLLRRHVDLVEKRFDRLEQKLDQALKGKENP